MAAPFQLFGADHLAALALVAALSILLVLVVRRATERRADRWLVALRIVLAALLLGATGAYLSVEASLRPLDVWDFAPLHLCDMAIFVAAFALLSTSRWAAEVLYFWACSGTVLAMITPDVAHAFPHRHFVAYFALHGGVVLSAIVLTFGYRLTPRRGAPWRVLLVTNGYAAAVAIVNLAFGTNFLYLLEKPSAPTVLDLLGPWPVYILVVELIAFALFSLLWRVALQDRQRS